MGYDTKNQIHTINERGYPVGVRDATTKGEWAQPMCVAQGAGPATLTGTTVETTMATLTIPGGLLGKTGALRITAFVDMNSNANAKTLRTKFNATTIRTESLASQRTGCLMAIIRNRNSEAAQMAYNPANAGVAGLSSATMGTAAVDTTQDVTLSITGQLGVGTDTLILEGWFVEVIPGV